MNFIVRRSLITMVEQNLKLAASTKAHIDHLTRCGFTYPCEEKEVKSAIKYLRHQTARMDILIQSYTK